MTLYMMRICGITLYGYAIRDIFNGRNVPFTGQARPGVAGTLVLAKIYILEVYFVKNE